MTKLKRTKAEYGGFLPLELNPGEELFARYEPLLMRFNTVKSSLNYLIQSIHASKIYIPYYYCPSTTEAIKKMVPEVSFYHIDENLMPIDLPDSSTAAVLLVDYFGVRSKEILSLADTFQKSDIIIDLAHAFFTKPLIKDHVHCIYSAKKIIGIPDGSYLISKTAESGMPMLSNAAEYADYLILSYEEGSNAAYSRKKETDQLLASQYTGMSRLSLGLLKNANYDRIQTRRKENYQFLYQYFKQVNELNLPFTASAYQFPLLLNGKGQALKKFLINNKIYVSTLWLGEDLLKHGSEFERMMSRDAVFLPIDQRYDLADMAYIADMVDFYLEGLNK